MNRFQVGVPQLTELDGIWTVSHLIPGYALAYGVAIPVSAAEFYLGLEQRFPERDEMYFLAEQVAEYDRKRLLVKDFLQMELFVSDEVSAIQWLRQQLLTKPQTFQELPLRANIDETVLPVIITERGENRNQCEEQRYVFDFSHGFAGR